MNAKKISASGRRERAGRGHPQAGRRSGDDDRRPAAWLELTRGQTRGLMLPGPAIPEPGLPPGPGLTPEAEMLAAAGAAVTTPAADSPGASSGAAAPLSAPPDDALPVAWRVLAVVARPGQESADLGAVLSAFRLRGAQLAVLCLTRGEGSELNSTCERLEALRPWELRVAAGLLGVSSVTIADYPDGQLGYLPPTGLAEHIARAARRVDADLLLVVDPAAAADLDSAAVARAASLAARDQGLPVLARTVAGPGQRWRVSLGEAWAEIRTRQRRAVEAHRSQRGFLSEPGDGADLAGAGAPEVIRWLVPPQTSTVLANQVAASHA